MTYTGVVKGRFIEIDGPIPYEEGQPVTVWMEPAPLRKGSPRAVLEAMRRPPHLTAEDVDALERSIEDAKLPVRDEGIFDDE